MVGSGMSTAIVVALISGAVSLAAATISLLSARNVARLNSQLEDQRRARTKQEQAEELRARYRDPLLGAVFDLQSRLYNIVGRKFLVRYYAPDDSAMRAYALDHTLHVVAEYLGWVEILRREVQFLDLGEEVADREWVTALESVTDGFASDDIDPVLRLFRGEQRAIGELMSVPMDDPDGPRRHGCIGYAGFTARRQEPEFSRWFERLSADIDLMAREPKAHLERPVLLQNALVEVLDVLDPNCTRFGAQRRRRLSLPSPDSEDSPVQNRKDT